MRILVTDGMDKTAMAELKAQGHEVVEQFYEPAELGKALRDFDVVVVRSKTKVRAAQIDEAKGSQLKLIIRGGVGVDNIDVDYAKAAGIDVPDSCRLLIVDVKRDINHVFARVEQLMPVIPLLRAANVDEAIEWALILERGLSHTAGMHSRNIDNMDKMARAMNTSLFVKNGPHLAALGAGGEGWTTMTISTPTGEGVTCARSFVRLRRCCVVDNFRIV